MVDTGPRAALLAPEVETRPGFGQRLHDAAQAAGSLVCIGLDPNPERLPPHAWDPNDVTGSIVRFNSALIEATADLVCAYKPNLGFYAALGEDGIAALVATRRLIPPAVPVILDCKVGDIGETARGYARGYFDAWGFDAITVNPYLGEDSLEPFLSYGDRGVLVVCKTSNPGSGDLQDLSVSERQPLHSSPETGSAQAERPLYLTVADRSAIWNTRYPATVGLVVGATYPGQLAEIRAHCPDLPILLPGVGAQAGDLDAALQAGLDSDGMGLVVSSSRTIIYASNGPDFAIHARQAAIDLRDAINAVRVTPHIERSARSGA
ncbi:MAG TPA: orotidine-5'-phosphate decarboxylase [Thermomicrobiales bacterium]|nr:orotidine-5'-phosphate decarboxylase [Thermomicrobiales bacterium]